MPTARSSGLTGPGPATRVGRARFYGPLSPDGPGGIAWTRLLDFISVAAALAIAFGVLEHYGARFWFFYDEWDFLLRENLGDQSSVHGFLEVLFAPHNEHISVLPRLWYWAASSVFGLRTYTPYVTASILVHMVSCVLVWMLLRQERIDRLVAFCVLVALLFLGVGAENVFWGFQVGFMGGVAFGLAALVVVRASRGRMVPDLVASALLCCAVLCSGTALPMLVAFVVAVSVNRSRRAAVVMLAPSIACLLVARSVGGGGSTGYSIPGSALAFAIDELRFAAAGITGVDSSIALLAIAGCCVLGGVLVLGVRRWELPIALGAGAVTFAVLTGVSRSAGLAAPDTMRYLWLECMLIAPILGVVLANAFGRWPWLCRAVVIAALAVSLRANVDAMEEFATSRPAGIAPNRTLVQGLVSDPERLRRMDPQTQIDPVLSPQLDAGLLLAAIKRGRFT